MKGNFIAKNTYITLQFKELEKEEESNSKLAEGRKW